MPLTPDAGWHPSPSVQIYDTQNVDSADWNLIGPDQWVEARKVAQVVVHIRLPEGSNNSTRWIDVNLAEQTLAVYDNNQLGLRDRDRQRPRAVLDQTGPVPDPDRRKKPRPCATTTSRTSIIIEDVPWTMYYDGPRALHGAYWRTRFGYPQSHGCVNLSVGDAHWLFNWAHEGDWVYVHDPSGQTPTDPAMYQGGAY